MILELFTLRTTHELTQLCCITHVSEWKYHHSVMLFNSHEWKYHHSVVLYNSPEWKVLPLSYVV